MNNSQNQAAFCIPPYCNGVAKASKVQAAFCIPPYCNGASNGSQRPRVEVALADPFKVLALA